MKTTNQSIEPNIADLANGWLKSYRLNLRPKKVTATEI